MHDRIKLFLFYEDLPRINHAVMYQNRMIRLFYFFLCVLYVLSSASAEKKLVLVASGEAHAMLEACDCPNDPGGGFAKRASLVTMLRDSNNVILVDAGGFGGGGVYDSYTKGRQGDSLRTLAAIRAMGYIKYDAVCIGDDDLQYGGQWLARQAFYSGVPLVSANCCTPDGRLLAAPFVIVKKGKYSIGITAVTTPERVLATDDSIVVKPPIPALRAQWKELRGKSDFQVILAHLGETESRMLLDTFPDCGLVVNGHRKNSTEEFITTQGQVMLQFGFQGKALSYAEIVEDSRGAAIGKTGWFDVGPNVPDDPVVSKLVSLPEANKAIKTKTVLDLYIMSQCQFGCAALKEFSDFLLLFPAVEWHVWFIGTAHIDSTLSALHGQTEISDEFLWLSVQAVYPEKWQEFLGKRALLGQEQTEAVVREMGLNLSKMKAWITKKGRSELALHYTRSMRMGINASPTLLVNNAVFSQEISKNRLAKLVCGTAEAKTAFCDSLPECLSDADCKKIGKVGKCTEKKGVRARCEYRDALRFSLTVVFPDSALFHPEYGVIAGITDDFPGVVVDSVRASSARGKKLIADYSPAFLPFFIFDNAVKNTENYSSIETGLYSVKDGLLFKPGMVKPSYFYKRKLTPKSCVLYVDQVFPGAKDAIKAVLSGSRINENVRIMPLVYPVSDSVGSLAEQALRQEEALRWLVIMEKYPNKYVNYLNLFVERKSVSYWFTDCEKLKINVDEFVKQVEANPSRISTYRREIEGFGMKEPVELLINNRELVSVKNQKELGEIVERVVK